MAGRQWTPAEVERFRQDWLSDKPTPEVGRMHGMSANGAWKRARDHGLPTKRKWLPGYNERAPAPPSRVWPKERDEALHTCITQGYSTSQAALLLNEEYPHLPSVSRNAVIGRSHRLGTSFGKKKRANGHTRPPRIRSKLNGSFNNFVVNGQPKPKLKPELKPELKYNVNARKMAVHIGRRAKLALNELPALEEIKDAVTGEPIPMSRRRGGKRVQDGCRWPVGESWLLEREDYYCNAAIVFNCYCMLHCRMAYNPTRAAQSRHTVKTRWR